MPVPGLLARAAEVPGVQAISVAEDDGASAVAVVLDRAGPHRVFALADPPRLVIDLPGIDPGGEAMAGGMVSAIRQGLFRPGVTRIVFDLSAPALPEEVTTDRSGALPVLRIRLEPVPPDTFAERAGWPEDARWESSRAATPQPAGGTEDIIVAIDPGHGGIDPGAAAGGVVEKAVVLDFARRLAGAVDAAPGWRAVLTREADVFVPLGARITRAHEARAHVFLSIHADVAADGRARGMSVYTLSGTGSDSTATRLAERENRADILAGADLGGAEDRLAELLIDLALRGSVAEGERLAGALIGALDGQAALLPTRPHRKGNFRVLKAPDMPSVLIELGFLNAAEDRERIVSPDWQGAVSAAVVDGLAAWAAKASPGFVAPRAP